MTGPEKTRIIYTEYTYPYYGIYLFSACVYYTKSVSFIEYMKILCQEKELLNLKDHQILSVDKNGFLRPGHMY